MQWLSQKVKQGLLTETLQLRRLAGSRRHWNNLETVHFVRIEGLGSILSWIKHTHWLFNNLPNIAQHFMNSTS